MASHKGLWQGPVQPVQCWVRKQDIKWRRVKTAWLGNQDSNNLERPEGWTAVNKMTPIRDEVRCTNAEEGRLAARPEVLVN